MTPGQRTTAGACGCTWAMGIGTCCRGGDIVVSVNGIAMNQPDQLATVMGSIKVGSTIKLRLFRAGSYFQVEYKLPERPLLPGDLPESGTFTPAPHPDNKTQMRSRLR